MPLKRLRIGALSWSADRFSGPFQIWLLAVMLMLVVWLMTFERIEEDRTSAVAGAEGNLVNLARLAQEHAERTIYSVDQTIRMVLEQYHEHHGRPDLKAMLEQGLIDRRVLLSVGVVDARGEMVLGDQIIDKRADVSDRDYFKFHRGGTDDSLFISRSVPGAAAHLWTIQLSRRLSGAHGEFAGVVVASVDPAYFMHFYRDLTLGAQGEAALIGLDGSVRARRSGLQEAYSGDDSSSPVLRRVAQGTLEGTLTFASVGDGIARTQHFRKLPSYPLLVSIGMSRQEILADHERIAGQRLRQASMISLLVLLLAAAVSWNGATRRRQQQAQAQALAHLQELTRQAPGVVFQYQLRPDGSACMPYASEGLLALCRLSPREVALDATPLWSLVHAYDAAGVEASLEESARTLRPWVHEFRISLDDGTVRWLSGQAAPQRLADGAILWNGFISDVSERKEREEHLTTLSVAVEQSPVSIVIADVEGSIQYVNRMFEKSTGYRAIEVLGKNPRILSSGNKSPTEYRALWDTLLAGKTWDGEFFNRRKDGTLFWEHATISPVLDERGVQTHYVAVKEDITDQKRQKAALLAEQARLQATLDAIPDLLFEIGLDGQLHGYHSPRVDLLAAPATDFIGKSITDILPPDAAAIGLAALSEASEQGHSVGKQYALDLPQGKTWFELSVARKATLPGEAQRFIVLARDITERMQADAQLRIAAIAFESQEGMFITDASGVMLRVNQAFTQITGYSAEEAVGQTPKLFSSGRHEPAFYAAMRGAIAHSGSWQGEIWNRRKNGEVYPEWLTITAVKDAQGTVTHYVATLTDITRRKQAEDQIKHLAFYDPLTALPNRRLLMDRLQQATAASVRSGAEGALLFIDLDNFKTINDTHGHGRGDLLLQQVGQRLAACVREGDTVARLGGDEYVVMLENLSRRPREAASQAESVGGKILYALNLPFDLVGNEYHITPSIGVTLFRGHESSADELMKRAELAMYQAKAAGRNMQRFFDPDMQDAVNARAAMERDLRNALLGKQFLLEYQPQVDEQGRLLGVEALVRWRHPELGMVSPAQFIPLAEEAGLILPLGHWVLQSACHQLRAWVDHPHTAHLTLSVNVSALQFHLDSFVSDVLETLRQTGAPPARLKLELTESLLVKDVDAIIAKMRELKSHGVGFSLDDFGTGYSSLSYLKSLPLDQLKIDQSFLHEALTHANDAAIVRAIVTLGQSLGMTVIAEGVETSAQRDFLVELGCLNFQGYFFGRPVPAADLIRFFRAE